MPVVACAVDDSSTAADDGGSFGISAGGTELARRASINNFDLAFFSVYVLTHSGLNNGHNNDQNIAG